MLQDQKLYRWMAVLVSCQGKLTVKTADLKELIGYKQCQLTFLQRMRNVKYFATYPAVIMGMAITRQIQNQDFYSQE
jgi:hypothetical protein